MSLLPPTDPTPAALGYSWPAEWAPHRATWLSWPHNRDTWPGHFASIPRVFAQLARMIAEHEQVHVLAGGAEVMADARRNLQSIQNVTLHDVETDDAWIRDHGPQFLLGPRGEPPALVDWQYNAWGGKYPPFDRDNDAPRQVAAILNRHRFAVPMVLEGGAIDGNGAGMVLAAERCLLDPRRNAGMSRDVAGQYLRQYCGARTVHWLRSPGIAGDDTDGHVDQIARFVNATTVVAAVEDDASDENYERLQQNLRQLSEFSAPNGRKLEIVAMPMPRPVLHAGQRSPASYCNFYLANELVLVPEFDDEADERAAGILADLFPDRRVRQLPARQLVVGLGAIHCVTQQEPAV